MSKKQGKKFGALTVHEIAHHRNGICGEPFYVVRFDDKEAGKNMIGIVFESNFHVAVLSADETAKGNIAFARGNSWRGDHFQADLRAAIAHHEMAARAA